MVVLTGPGRHGWEGVVRCVGETLARVRRPTGYLALRTLTHVTSTRARANGVRHIMFETLLQPNAQR
jgi:hypothetical protein